MTQVSGIQRQALTAMQCLPTGGRKPRNLVHFQVDKELDGELDLLSDLAHFLAEGATPEWGNAPCLTAKSPKPTKSPQHSLALVAGTQPKVLAVASSIQSCSWSQARPGRERPDPVRYPHHWITDEMSQPSSPHPHWWREIKASGKLNVGAYIVHEEYDDYSAKHHALWFLPLTHQEASRWWNTPPTLQGLCPQDFLPPCLWPLEFQDHLTVEDTGCSQDAVGLCRSIQSQVRSPMQSHQGAPSMHGPIDDHQWRWCYGSLPVEEKSGPSPTLEEETALPGEGDGISGAPGPAPQQVEIPRFIEPV